MAGVVLVMDIRSLDFISGYTATFQEIRNFGHTIEVLFFDATDEMIIRRFSETRSRHPVLSSNRSPKRSVSSGNNWRGCDILPTRSSIPRRRTFINSGNRVLAYVRGCDESREMTVHLQSFGFRYGIPLESDMVFDVRFLPNPHFVPELKRLPGSTRQFGTMSWKSSPP